MITKELKSWEEADGFICNWLICGPFDAELKANAEPNLFDAKYSGNWDTDMLEAWGGECGIKDIPAAEGPAVLNWFPVESVYDPKLQLEELRIRYAEIDAAIGNTDSNQWDKLWYALAVVEADEDCNAQLNFSGWDGCRLWINGEPVFEEHSYHHIILEMESVPLELNKGINTILFKLDRDGCAARIVCEDSTCAEKGIRLITTAENPGEPKIATVNQLQRWSMEHTTTNPFTGTSSDELTAWQEEARTWFHQCLGSFPPIPDGDTELFESETTSDGIERRLYHMPSEADSILPFYVLIPAPKKRNGKYITVAHGHGRRWKDVAGVNPPPDMRSSAYGEYLGDYAYQLSRNGFVTSVCCERAFADRRDYTGNQDLCTRAFMMAIAQGYVYPALHMHDIRRMTEFVMDLPEVQGMSGPGLTGLSGGGTMTYLLGAFDDMYKACAIWCGICRYRYYAQSGGCGMQVVPRLWPTLDVGELLGLIAPRPLLIGQGTRDATFNVLTAQSVYGDALRAYSAAGVPDNVNTCFYEKAHQVNIEAASDFFEGAL